MSSPTAPPENPSRHFGSFSEAARENADSRVRAGLHFRFSVEQGLKLGSQIADYAAHNLLTPAEQ